MRSFVRGAYQWFRSNHSVPSEDFRKPSTKISPSSPWSITDLGTVWENFQKWRKKNSKRVDRGKKKTGGWGGLVKSLELDLHIDVGDPWSGRLICLSDKIALHWIIELFYFAAIICIINSIIHTHFIYRKIYLSMWIYAKSVFQETDSRERWKMLWYIKSGCNAIDQAFRKMIQTDYHENGQ